MKISNPHRVSLVFNEHNIYSREIMAGVAKYIQTTRVAWDLFLDENLRSRLHDIDQWEGDGIIGDFNDPVIRGVLSKRRVPVVAVGTSYEDESNYPPQIPYVANDNLKVVTLAYEHLIDVGMSQFALFSLPHSTETPWVEERENAFKRLIQNDKLHLDIYTGQVSNSPSWSEEGEKIIQWLRSLPKPIGIIAITDVRARHLLQLCLIAGIAVPEEIAIVGVDSDPLARMLTRITLSSVIQGTQDMGYTAAQLLHQMLNGARVSGTRAMIAPTGINVLASSQHQLQKNPYVMRALHFIRQYACQGIKTEQVADYVGVSRTSLQTHFHSELGHSVHEEILRYKLKLATTMLAEESCNIAEVAQRCGFTSVQYIHSVFKREFDCSPREYQERIARTASAGDAAPLKRGKRVLILTER